MVDKTSVIHAFNAYVNNFDDSEPMISNKIAHTFHVARNSEWISKALRLDTDSMDVAWLIGILHDIGRFEQIKRTHAYTDKSFDHATAGVDLLFNSGMITEFIKNHEWFEIIRKAILYHNKLIIPGNLSDKEKLFCNIIRDADKIDNFRGFHENDFVSFHERSLEAVQNSEITEGVLQCFREHRTIPHHVIKTDADFFLLPYAMYFGIVFDVSRDLIGSQGNYIRMLDFIFEGEDNQTKFDEIKQHIYQYMADRARSL